MFHNIADQHGMLDHTTYNLSTTCSNQFWLRQNLFWEKWASRRHIKNHPGKYQEMNFHQDTSSSFQVCGFVPLPKRTIFIDFKYPQQCVFLLRWWREVIWLKLEINAISQFDDILRQAAFQCNVCTGRICLRIKLKKCIFKDSMLLLVHSKTMFSFSCVFWLGHEMGGVLD